MAVQVECNFLGWLGKCARSFLVLYDTRTSLQLRYSLTLVLERVDGMKTYRASRLHDDTGFCVP